VNGDGTAATGEIPVDGAGDPRRNERADLSAVRSLDRTILLCAGVILAGITLFGRYGMLPGAACGAAIAYGNFYLLRKILGRAFSGAGGRKSGFVVSYVLKFLALVTAVYLVIRSGRFDLLGFLLGLSSLVAGVLLEGLSRAVEPR